VFVLQAKVVPPYVAFELQRLRMADVYRWVL
jgi:hypothetical protein